MGREFQCDTAPRPPSGSEAWRAVITLRTDSEKKGTLTHARVTCSTWEIVVVLVPVPPAKLGKQLGGRIPEVQLHSHTGFSTCEACAPHASALKAAPLRRRCARDAVPCTVHGSFQPRQFSIHLMHVSSRYANLSAKSAPRL